MSALPSPKAQSSPEQETLKSAEGGSLSGSGGGVSLMTDPSHATYRSVTASKRRLRDIVSTAAAWDEGVRPLKVSTRSNDGTTSNQFRPEPVVRYMSAGNLAPQRQSVFERMFR